MKGSPGCFGLAIVHSRNPICVSCDFLQGCRGVAKETLEVMDLETDVRDLMKHYQDLGAQSSEDAERTVVRNSARDMTKLKLTIAQCEQLAAMPRKVAPIAKAMMQDGINVRAKLQAGKNPFSEGKWEFIGIACELLLGGGFTKKQLSLRLLEKHQRWQTKTAESYVSISFSLLSGLEAIREKTPGF